jgi:hypothetical protein
MKLNKTAAALALSYLTSVAQGQEPDRIDEHLFADTQAFACTADGHSIVYLVHGGIEAINMSVNARNQMENAINDFKQKLHDRFTNFAAGITYEADLKPFKDREPPKLQIFTINVAERLTSELGKSFEDSMKNDGNVTYGYGVEVSGHDWSDSPDPYCSAMS